MKKKIKDLTKEEIEIICNKHGNCFECPLIIYDRGTRIYCANGILSREVEVNESDNEI